MAVSKTRLRAFDTRLRRYSGRTVSGRVTDFEAAIS